jgi:hypothetical protein
MQAKATLSISVFKRDIGIPQSSEPSSRRCRP